VRRLRGTALALQADVADADQVERVAAAIEAQLGPVDVWVNNAMASVFSPVIEMTPADYERVTAVTYLGVWNIVGAQAHGTAQSWRDYPGGLGPRIPRDPPAVGVLRRQTCGPRLPRLASC
jgi:NAD(P)-dependent dehydrogenase (short-subunit alcohol dehydrogenase family)